MPIRFTSTGINANDKISNPTRYYNEDLAIKEIIKNNDTLTFTYDSANDVSGQTPYTLTFDNPTECDILIVGGGGAGGGGDDGGGGGAGGLVLIENITLNGEYEILVGRGGVGDSSEGNDSENGKNTIFNVDGIDGENRFTAFGGGGGGVGADSNTNLRKGKGGGSGGGASGEFKAPSGGSSTQVPYDYDGTQRGYGNKGGDNLNTENYMGSAGGGGAGSPGYDSINNSTRGVPGGDGLANIGNIDFKTHFDLPTDNSIGQYIATEDKVYFAGGGGGGNHNGVARNNNSGGKGGGGQGSTSGSGRNGSNGLINSGGGGGGAQIQNSSRGKGGDGGSGIVIIKFKQKFGQILRNPANEFIVSKNYNIDLLKLKYNNWITNTDESIYHLGNNIGIGTDNPKCLLDVIGGISATIKNFKIEHPLDSNMVLYHTSLEAPRYDNIYRGKKIIKNGYGEVNIDKECNTTGGMLEGTFKKLNKNYQLYLRNNETYDGVRGYIEDNLLKIFCENNENITIDWLVIGERNDKEILNNNKCISGSLLCEHKK